jgi:hypothetical protein
MTVLLDSRFVFFPVSEPPGEVELEFREHILHRAEASGYCTKVQYLSAGRANEAVTVWNADERRSKAALTCAYATSDECSTASNGDAMQTRRLSLLIEDVRLYIL